MLDRLNKPFTNIKDVTLNQDLNDSRDIAQLITPEEWDGILGSVKSTIGRTDYDMFLEEQARLHILNPFKVDTLSERSYLFHLIRKNLISDFESDIDKAAWPIVSLSIFSPTLIKELDINQDVWDFFDQRIKDYEANSKLSLSPTDQAIALRLNGILSRGISNTTENLFYACKDKSQKNDFYDLAINAKDLRLLNPNHPKLPSEDLIEIRKEVLFAKKTKDWGYFLDIASSYRVASAEEIIMTDKGLYLRMPAPFQNQENNFPERRSF